MLYRQLCHSSFCSITLTFSRAALQKMGSLIGLCLFSLLIPQLPAYATQSIHMLKYNNVTWADQDLTTVTGGGIPNGQGGIAAFYTTTPNKQFHVYYVDTSQHVRQLYWNRVKWSDQDLTALTGGKTATIGTEVSGFAVGNLQYVFFLGSDLHVHELSYNNVSWSDQDITVLGGGVVTDFVNVTAINTKPNGYFHVFYERNNSNDVHELTYNGTSWNDQSLSAITGLLGNRGWTSGFAIGTQEHLFLSGYDPSDALHLFHLYFNGKKWLNEDISAKVGRLPLDVVTGVAAFRVPGTSQLEAYAITNDTDIHQYTRLNNVWSDIDLTATAGGPNAQELFQITACVTPANKQFHMFYEQSFDNVYQYYFNGTNWLEENIGGSTWQSGGMASFAIGNLQYVFYVGQ